MLERAQKGDGFLGLRLKYQREQRKKMPNCPSKLYLW